MTFQVDFNMRDAKGRVPALVDDAELLSSLHRGETVLAQDAEGNQCKATVEDVDTRKGVAYLALVPGSSDPNHHTDWLVETR